MNERLDSSYSFTFTVFTPTFNRAYCLQRLYDSLVSQTFHDFEWLIVDDGSMDNTETFVKEWQTENKIIIRYIRQENGGKHRAINCGVREAHGELFLIIDSDDMWINNALERFYTHWMSIPESDRGQFQGVTAKNMDINGNSFGGDFPKDHIDCNSIELREKYKITGDMGGFIRTDILKATPFPEIPGEKFIPESIIWHRIDLKYKTRFVSDKLKVVEYMQDGLTAKSNRVYLLNPQGMRLYYLDFLEFPKPWHKHIRLFANYARYSLHSKIPFAQYLRDSKRPFLAISMFLIGYMKYRSDCKMLGLKH